MKDRVILHSDANNFFASVECIGKDRLKKLPVAVTGNPNKRNGIILAKNEIAKKLGVKTGEAIWQAKQKAPDIVCLPFPSDGESSHASSLLVGDNTA